MHDRGRLLTHGLLMLAGGGESCSDIEHLRAQRGLFGEVASDSTLYRVLRDIDSSTLEGVWAVVAGVRARVWRARDGDAVSPGPLVLDIDSTLVEVHTETKQGAAPDFKGGFGFHPMLCATSDGEPLWIVQRRGNAAANILWGYPLLHKISLFPFESGAALIHVPTNGRTWLISSTIASIRSVPSAADVAMEATELTNCATVASDLTERNVPQPPPQSCAGNSQNRTDLERKRPRWATGTPPRHHQSHMVGRPANTCCSRWDDVHGKALGG